MRDDVRGDRHVDLAEGCGHGNGRAAQDRALAIGDHEPCACGGLLREYALRACAARRVGGVVAQRVYRHAQRGHVADELDRDRARAFVGGDAQARARLGVGKPRRLECREYRDQRQRKQRRAQDQEQLGAGRQAPHRRDQACFTVAGSDAVGFGREGRDRLWNVRRGHAARAQSSLPRRSRRSSGIASSTVFW